jgi:REP-associated tyrosine transposase
MGTHYHLLVDCSRANLSNGMRLLNGRYAQAYNARHARRGHLFADRFSAKAIEDERHLSAALDYILENRPSRPGPRRGRLVVERLALRP